MLTRGAYVVGDWPFGGDPIFADGFVLLVVIPESWIAEAPKLTAREHARGLVALDPRCEKLFAPGEDYVVDE